MLIRFIVSNFLSFKEETEFSMISGNFKIHSDHIYNDVQGYKLLKVASIYGSNASGKTNFVNAINYLTNLVIKGTKNKNHLLKPPMYKLDSAYKNLPTKFEIEFLNGSTIYSYAISILGSVIEREWLVKIYSNKKDEIIFDRSTNKKHITKIKFGSEPKDQKEGLRREIYAEELRFNQPFIYEGYNKNFDEIKPAYDWFFEKLRIVYPSSAYGGLVKAIALDKDYKKKANDLLKIAGTGIESLEAEIIGIDEFFGVENKKTKEEILNELKDNNTIIRIEGEDQKKFDVFLDNDGKPIVVKLYTIHKSVEGEKVIFEIGEESDGTIRLIDLIPAFIESIEKGKTYIVDEIDRSMHPNLIKGLINLYLDTSNKLSKGQFIFTTHESNLLDLSIFRQDEIWFMEKEDGASRMYSLSDFKPRYDKDIKKGYLKGMFGAIPFIGSPKNLNW